MKDSLLPGTRQGVAVNSIHQRLKGRGRASREFQVPGSLRGKRCSFWKQGCVRKAHSQKSGFELCCWGVGTSPQPHPPWCRAGSRKTFTSSPDGDKAKRALQGPQCDSTSSIHLPPLPSRQPRRATPPRHWLAQEAAQASGWASLGRSGQRLPQSCALPEPCERAQSTGLGEGLGPTARSPC